MLFICEPFGNGSCAARIYLTIAQLPCVLGLFRKAVIVELITAPFLEGESTVYWAWENSQPRGAGCQRRRRATAGSSADSAQLCLDKAAYTLRNEGEKQPNGNEWHLFL